MEVVSLADLDPALVRRVREAEQAIRRAITLAQTGEEISSLEWRPYLTSAERNAKKRFVRPAILAVDSQLRNDRRGVKAALLHPSVNAAEIVLAAAIGGSGECSSRGAAPSGVAVAPISRL